MNRAASQIEAGIQEIPHDQLHADAMVNAPEIRPSEIRGMTEVLNEMFGGGMLPDPPSSCGSWNSTD